MDMRVRVRELVYFGMTQKKKNVFFRRSVAVVGMEYTHSRTPAPNFKASQTRMFTAGVDSTTEVW